MSPLAVHRLGSRRGYAEYVTVPEGFAYRIPARFKDVEAAPLLCAGIIGYRALLRANVPAGAVWDCMALVAPHTWRLS